MAEPLGPAVSSSAGLAVCRLVFPQYWIRFKLRIQGRGLSRTSELVKRSASRHQMGGRCPPWNVRQCLTWHRHIRRAAHLRSSKMHFA